MTSVRLIPCLDVDQGRVVKGTNFVEIRDAGDAVDLAKYYNQEGADELVFLDITASHEGRDTAAELAAQVAREVFIPFTIGGGIRSVDQMRTILRAGADKVSVNSAAVADPELIRQGAEVFGAQCIVVAIDAKRDADVGWRVVVHGGRKFTEWGVVDWAQQVEGLGAGEILLTSMDGDGTRSGYDLELTRAVSESVSIPVIASGGAGNAQHLIDAVQKGRADAVLLAGILHDRVARITDLKAAMQDAGILIRPVPVDLGHSVG